jgi:hypothetical protein
LNLDVNLSSIVFTPTGSTGTLEKDMDAMLNSLLKLFLTEYSTLVRESLIGLVEGPAQHALTDFVNGFIDHVSTQTCREIPEEDAPEYVNFHDFGFLHQLNDFLKQSLGVINQYISCVADVFNRSNQPVSFEVENVHVNLTNISIKNPACIKQLGRLKKLLGGVVILLNRSNQYFIRSNRNLGTGTRCIRGKQSRQLRPV